MPKSITDKLFDSVSRGPKLLLGADPAAGSELTITATNNEVWKIYAVRFVLTTSAIVANRRVNLILDDGGANAAFKISANTDQVASQTRGYTWAQGLVSQQLNEMHNPLPNDVIMGLGWRLRTACDSLQGTDDFGAPVIYYELLDS